MLTLSLYEITLEEDEGECETLDLEGEMCEEVREECLLDPSWDEMA